MMNFFRPIIILLLFATIILGFKVGYAQMTDTMKVTNPSVFLKGSISYYFTDHKKDMHYPGKNRKETILEAVPQFGVYVSPSFIIGIKCGFTQYHFASLANFESSKLVGGTVIYGSFLRYENKTGNKRRVSFFIEVTFENEKDVNLRENWRSGNGETGISAIMLHRQSFYATLGLAYHIGKYLHAEINILSLNYSRYKLNSDDFNSSTLKFNYNIIQPNIGLSFRF